jgi:putative transcriptional regulator
MGAFGWPRLAVVVATFTLQTAFLRAALPPHPEEAPGRTSLAGQFLIATPAMEDPRFARTVILIVEHSETGALGVVLNRPVGEQKLKDLLDAVGEKGAEAAGSVPIFAGGPVQPEVGFVVHSPDYRIAETVAVTDRVSMTSSVKILKDIAAKSGPAKTLIAFGYAGWGAGQLEGEIEAGAWATAEADPALVFDADRDKLWDDAWERRTQHL